MSCNVVTHGLTLWEAALHSPFHSPSPQKMLRGSLGLVWKNNWDTWPPKNILQFIVSSKNGIEWWYNPLCKLGLSEKVWENKNIRDNNAMVCRFKTSISPWTWAYRYSKLVVNGEIARFGQTHCMVLVFYNRGLVTCTTVRITGAFV